jgi:hypothetical protein
MGIWQFFDYYPDGGGCPITDWYNAQAVDVRAKFDATVDDMGITENWDDPELRSFGVLSRKPEHAGLAQVKFYVIQHNKKRQHRAIGRWRQDAKEFIFLVGFQKSGRTTIPQNALNEAVRLLGELELQRGEIHEHNMAEAGEGQELP